MSPSLPVSGKDILLVDDDPTFSALLAMQLRSRGHNVRYLDNGNSAVEVVEAGHFDLVLLDVVMPGIDGLEVVRQLRHRPATAATPIVLLTGRYTDEDILSAWHSGADYYVVKPFVLPQLLYFIATLPDSGVSAVE